MKNLVATVLLSMGLIAFVGCKKDEKVTPSQPTTSEPKAEPKVPATSTESQVKATANVTCSAQDGSMQCACEKKCISGKTECYCDDRAVEIEALKAAGKALTERPATTAKTCKCCCDGKCDTKECTECGICDCTGSSPVMNCK